jgi:alkaline phosphatase D
VLAGATAAGVLVAFGGEKALARGLPRPPRLPSNPFTLGVASGDPLPDGIVVWTRLALAPLTADGGLGGAGNLEVGWEVARDERMHGVVRSGRAVAPADLAHSVHVDVRGLEPGREYWYRFTTGDWASPVARTRTAPAPDGRLDRMTFAYATCQKWEEGFYNAYAHMAEEDLDLVVFLGDYTYEYGIDPATGGVRGVQLPPEYAKETVTLDQFRLQHALYKTDGDLQRAHARFPFVVTWDDHEVDNDYTGDIPEDGTPPEVFLRRRPQGLCPLRGRAGPPARRPALRRAGGSPGRSRRSPASSSRTAAPARCRPDAAVDPSDPFAVGEKLVDEDPCQPALVAAGRPASVHDEEAVELGRHEGVDDVGGIALSQLRP